MQNIFFVRGVVSQDYPDPMCRNNNTLQTYDPPLLYNLNEDPSEIYNLNVAEYSDIIDEINEVQFPPS